MRIYFSELSEDLKELEFSDKDTWVKEAVESTQEVALSPKSVPLYVRFDLRKSQSLVFVDGKLDIQIGLLCSRCANPITYPMKTKFRCLLTKDKELESKSHQGFGHFRESETELDKEPEIEIDVVDREYLELEEVLKEQVLLKIPLQPLCKEDCKGICPVCGQDRNTNPCQCHRIKNTALANALRNYKV